jgi:DNA helicase-2/ATP-dependent DNA helicase PcrA
MSTTLNTYQQQAVMHTHSPLLIIAGAGSGKTTVITHKINHLITHHGVDPESILAITFTNKAATEMKQRVMALTEGTAYPMVNTFHAFSAFVLRHHFNQLGGSTQFAIIDMQEQNRLLKRIMDDLQVTDQKYRPQYVASILGNLKNELIGPRGYAEGKAKGVVDDTISEIYTRYQSQLWQNHAVDFSDLLYFVAILFSQHPDVLMYYQEKFKYVLVDEYQDTNHAQYMLIKQLAAAHHNLTVVGDFDQNIYSWRGANIQNILRFEKEYTNATVIKLEENYRSTDSILKAANAVIDNNKQRKEKKLWTKNEEGDKLICYFAPDEHAEARFVIKQIHSVREKGVFLSEMVILFRINALSRIYEEALSKASIPFKIVGGVAFFQRKEIKDIMAYLRLVLNPNDTIAFLRVVNVPARQIGETTMNQLRTQALSSNISISELITQGGALVSSRALANITAFVALIDELKADYNHSDTDRIGIVLKAILEKTGYRAMLEQSQNPQDQERLENILQFISIAREEELELDEFITKLSLATELESQNQVSKDSVTLMTMHHAKGLEYHTVFIVGMEEGMLPHYRALKETDEMEEERRLCYVAITRGKKQVLLTGAQQRSVFGEPRFQKPSRFISEIPQKYIEHHGISVQKRVERASFLASPSVESVEVTTYQEGETVMHAAWGTGVVTQIQGNGADAVLYVMFNGKIKKLLARYAPLMKG